MITKLLIYLFPLSYLRFFRSKFYTRLYFVREYEKMVQLINKGTFVRERLMEFREEKRREYDKANESLDAAKIALSNNQQNPEPNKEVIGTLERMIEGKTKDIEQYKKQIDEFDKQIIEPGGAEDLIASYRETLPLLEKMVRKTQ